MEMSGVLKTNSGAFQPVSFPINAAIVTLWTMRNCIRNVWVSKVNKMMILIHFVFNLKSTLSRT